MKLISHRSLQGVLLKTPFKLDTTWKVYQETGGLYSQSGECQPLFITKAKVAQPSFVHGIL